MDQAQIELLQKVGEIYTPSYPIEIKTLFAGRKEQLLKAYGIIPQKGMQLIIFGDRGVGKTSFANVLKVICESDHQIGKVSCNTQDTFDIVWKTLLSSFSVTFKKEVMDRIGFNSELETQEDEVSLSSAFAADEKVSINKIMELLKLLKAPILIFDEFDRLEDRKFDKKLFTDTIKAISDSLPYVTIIIIGVSDDVSSLIQSHESIERNLAQIHMPTMNGEEIREIATKGQPLLGLTFKENVLEKIVKLSSGFPHFTHSLCYHSSNSAIYDGAKEIDEIHLRVAIKQTIDNAHESLRNSYRVATLATKQNIFSEVLLAASLVETDEYGYFQANDLEPILSAILARDIRVNNFTFHLGKLCHTERGEIFKVTGSKNRHRYKFRNPLMKAFIRLKSETTKH